MVNEVGKFENVNQILPRSGLLEPKDSLNCFSLSRKTVSDLDVVHEKNEDITKRNV